MQLPKKQSDAITDCAARLKELAETLLKPLDPSGPARQLPPSRDLLAEQPPKQVCLLQSGQVDFCQDGRVISCHQPGDLLGLSRQLLAQEGRYRNEAPVTLIPYDRDQLWRQAPSNALLDYLVHTIAFYRQALAQEMQPAFEPNAGFMSFAAGETIIHQGAQADRVYTLLEGRAEALRDGMKVGDIEPQEIFGALAVFTRQSRMASVAAVTDCSVLAVRKEDFSDLIEQQPHICLKLIEEMADKINQLNGQLLGLQTKN
mgnify:CR=1 FL=1